MDAVTDLYSIVLPYGDPQHLAHPELRQNLAVLIMRRRNLVLQDHLDPEAAVLPLRLLALLGLNHLDPCLLSRPSLYALHSILHT